MIDDWGGNAVFQILEERGQIRMKRYVLVGLAALAVGAVLQASGSRLAGPMPADLRIAQQDNPGTPNYPDEPRGPYVQQHLDNQEGGGPGSNS
jgi:hypothetical protein